MHSLSSDRPKPIVIDWWARFPLFMTQRHIPRSSWYLYHCMTNEWPEFGFKEVSRALGRTDVEALIVRGVRYREVDRLYQAFEEFAWDPDLSIDDYAHLYIIKRFRREDPELAAAYANWIRVIGYSEMLADPDIPQAWIEREDIRGRLTKEVTKLSPRLTEIGVPHEFLSLIHI